MQPISSPGRKLAVLLPGMGAVATTLIAGVEMHRRGKNVLIGSLAHNGRLAPATDAPEVPLKTFLPLEAAERVVFGGWDIQPANGYEVALRSGVLNAEDLEKVAPTLRAIRPRPGIHDERFVRRLRATHTIAAHSHREKIETVRRDIRDMVRQLGADRAVMVFTASTETHVPPGDAFESLRALEKAIDEDDPCVSPTIMYAYAALQEEVPFANATPNVCTDTKALQELAAQKRVPIAGKDLKSGQTMMKTVIAPALKARLLGLNGWFSTNILGNRDGEVLDDPAAFKSKELTKSGVLDTILDAEAHPDLYGNISHKVSIHYYPPRGDAKEGWDNIDLFGWMHYPMQIKVNFLCRDSILAAPLVLDIAMFLDLAQRMGRSGVQQWLSFYFKCPVTPPGVQPQHDLFAQLHTLNNTLRAMARENDARGTLELVHDKPTPAVARS